MDLFNDLQLSNLNTDDLYNDDLFVNFLTKEWNHLNKILKDTSHESLMDKCAVTSYINPSENNNQYNYGNNNSRIDNKENNFIINACYQNDSPKKLTKLKVPLTYDLVSKDMYPAAWEHCDIPQNIYVEQKEYNYEYLNGGFINTDGATINSKEDDVWEVNQRNVPAISESIKKDKYKSNLYKENEVIVKGKRNYKCIELGCNKIYKNSGYLKDHLERSNNRPYECTICRKYVHRCHNHKNIHK